MQRWSVGRLEIAMLTLGPLATNCFVLAERGGDACAIVDPGAEAPRLLAALAELRWVPQAIWLTHAHFDHVGAVAGVRREFPVPVHLHPADRPFYDQAALQAARWGLEVEAPDVPPLPLRHGDELQLGALRFEVRHTPGHAPGHVVLVAHEEGVLVGGDMLFRGSIGRTDLPGSDPQAMERSLREQVLTLPDTLQLLPGHGPETTLGLEQSLNPFVHEINRGGAIGGPSSP